MIDYYKTLRISHLAGTIEIRKAYRKRALELHPDVNSSTTAKEEFIQINKAYSVLKNAITKIRYDKLYRFYVLNEDVPNENRFRHRESSRTRSYSRKSNRGNSRAEKYSKKGTEEFKGKQKKSSTLDNFWSVIGMFVEVLGAFL
ncbi:MAG: J domain-containing protein [Crocinitomicaceae bacterium]|nr:J domain-containing protein [Flavobacteriales bacterium]NQZ37376.1 J domain-containing protein [Crocinitomicaceae bacterium]